MFLSNSLDEPWEGGDSQEEENVLHNVSDTNHWPVVAISSKKGYAAGTIAKGETQQVRETVYCLKNGK
jgi:hypothetical protein